MILCQQCANSEKGSLALVCSSGLCIAAIEKLGSEACYFMKSSRAIRSRCSCGGFPWCSIPDSHFVTSIYCSLKDEQVSVLGFSEYHTLIFVLGSWYLVETTEKRQLMLDSCSSCSKGFTVDSVASSDQRVPYMIIMSITSARHADTTTLTEEAPSFNQLLRE